jgi:hypothetical protein
LFEKKKKEVEDQSIPPRLELSEYFGLVFSFLWFHRGIVIAGLVLLGLYCVLTMAKNQVAENKRRDREAPAFVYMPPTVDNDVQINDEFQNIGNQGVSPLPTDPMPLVKRPVSKATRRTEDPSTVRFRKFVATASADSLLRKSKVLLEEVTRLTPPEAVMNLTRRQQISKRLREMELNPDQLVTLAIADLESLSQLDAINVQHRMEIPDLRQRLFELAESLLNHPSVAVSAKAHLAFVAARGVDLLIEPTREELDLLTTAYQRHIDQVMLGTLEPIVAADLLQAIASQHLLDEAVAMRRDLANRVLSRSSLGSGKLDVAVEERLVFGDLRLQSLLGRMDIGDQLAIDEIDLLFQRLEQFPEARKSVFQIAVAVVGKHLVNEQFDHASRLVGWLERVHPNIPDPDTQRWVGESLAQYSEKIRLSQSQIAR